MDFYKLLWIPRSWTGGAVCREAIYYSVGERDEPEERCVGEPFIIPWGIMDLKHGDASPHGIINGSPTHRSSGSSHRHPNQFFKQHYHVPTLLCALLRCDGEDVELTASNSCR